MTEKRIMRNLTSILLALMLCITMMPVGVFADSTTAEEPLSVKSLWASEHAVGKVKFKWTAKTGVSVNGWNLHYRTRKIGAGGSWSKWTLLENLPASIGGGGSDKGKWIDIPKDYVIEIHAQAVGDTTWSTGIITTPAGGKYQAMKNVYVTNTANKKHIGSTITLTEGQSIKVRPDYQYPVSDTKKRPRLYPSHMLYDVADRSVISITKPDGSAYSGGMIDGNATITGKKTGSSQIIFRAPNGRTQVVSVTVRPDGAFNGVNYADTYVPKRISDPKVYTFDNSIFATDTTTGRKIRLKDVLETDENKKVILKGKIHLNERFRVCSNTEIDATEGKSGIGAGATIYSGLNGDGCLTNTIDSTNYDAASNIIIRGGTWKKEDGYHERTMMLFAHASNIRVEDAYVECSYKEGHCIEMAACKGVVIKNCNLQMKGTNPANNEDEPLQIDHANARTVPTIKGLVTGNATVSNCYNNNPCHDIQIINCTLQGGRGLCAGHCGNDKAAQNIYHTSIVVQDSNITGQSSEALAIYNTVGCEVSGNTIRTNTKDTTSYRSDGMCVRIPEGSKAPAAMKTSTVTIRNNKVYGGRSGIIVNSLSASDFGKVVVTGNTVYYKGNAKNAITVSKWYNNKSSAGCAESVISGNTTHKGW